MELNTGEYQLGRNDKLLSLWGDRLKELQQASPEWLDDVFARAHKLLNRHKKLGQIQQKPQLSSRGYLSFRIGRSLWPVAVVRDGTSV